MTKNINFFDSGKTFSKTTSKGNQLKECRDGYWYKTDFLGYEGAAEWVASKMLANSGGYFVNYDLVSGVSPVQCKSKDFLESNASLVTINRLIEKCLGLDVAKKCATMKTRDAVKWFVDSIESITGLNEFGRYLSGMIALDTVTLNEDRHFRNIAVIREAVKGFSFAPIFDNGAAFLSDCYTYPKGDLSREYLEQLMSQVDVKPFGHTFDEQLDAVEELYGTPLQFEFIDVFNSDLVKYYDTEVLTRIDFVLRESKRKYKYLFKGES